MEEIRILNVIPEEIAYYEIFLSEIASSDLEMVHKYDGHQLPYRWEFRTRGVDARYVATVEFSPDDILAMNGKSDDQKRDYLRAKFGASINSF